MDSKTHQAIMTVVKKPGEQHSGPPAVHGHTPDQQASQIDTERHQPPQDNVPEAGSAPSNKRPRIKRSTS